MKSFQLRRFGAQFVAESRAFIQRLFDSEGIPGANYRG